MNKDEIKKALDCCAKSYGDDVHCTDCPYDTLTPRACCERFCQDVLCKDALNLITEQEQEIELLKMQMKDVVNHADTFLVEEQKFEAENVKLKAEIEQLKEENEQRRKLGILGNEVTVEFHDDEVSEHFVDCNDIEKYAKQFRNRIISTNEKEIKQAKIDVLNELKTRHDYAIKNMGYPWDISQQIDELIKEVEK